MYEASHLDAAVLADEDLVPMAPEASPDERARPRPSAGQVLTHVLRDRLLANDAEYRQFGPGFAIPTGEPSPKRPAENFLFAAESDPHDPDDVFRALRWGGQFVYASRDPARIAELPEKFIRRGFEVDRRPGFVRKPVLGLSLPLLSPKVYYFVARKVHLTLPKEVSERFTYHVHLDRDGIGGRHVVLKEIPSVERVSARLRHKFPDATDDLIERRALKFTEKVFPLFLTREAAMLKLLARDLPEQYRGRVPHVIDMEQDSRGFVRRLRMNWLRNAPPGGRAISQLEFALQSADLLRAIHDHVGIIHLDLRLDNMVVTDQGVGFVDFGSAVRIGENIQGNPLLNTIFDELMRTSQIQRMLEKMTVEGMVTSKILNECHGKVDKGVDLFYLALQINKPLGNPDFRGLVKFDRMSEQAEALGVLTEEVLKPRDPAAPTIKSAAEMLAGVQAVADRINAPTA